MGGIITNATGSANCSISQWRFVLGIAAGFGGNCTNGNCEDFSIMAPSPITSLPPGQSTQITIAFNPLFSSNELNSTRSFPRIASQAFAAFSISAQTVAQADLAASVGANIDGA